MSRSTQSRLDVVAGRLGEVVLRTPVLGAAAAVIVVLALVALVTAPPVPVTEDAALTAFREQLAADASGGDGSGPAPTGSVAPSAPATSAPDDAASQAPPAAPAASDDDGTDGADAASGGGAAAEEPTSEPSPQPAAPTRPASTDTSYARPAQGVYRFRVDGGESLDVPGGSRTYPQEATATVLHDSDGCGWTSRIKLAEEHEDEYEFCTDASGHSMRGVESVVEFFGQSERQDFTCTPPLVLPEAKADPASSVTCRDAAAGVDARITVRVTGEGARSVGGAAVDAVRLLYDVTFTGNSEGSSTIETWVARTSGALLSLDRETDTMVQTSAGRRHYQEQVTMELLSVTPRS